jgi:hypothetical protein
VFLFRGEILPEQPDASAEFMPMLGRQRRDFIKDGGQISQSLEAVIAELEGLERLGSRRLRLAGFPRWDLRAGANLYIGPSLDVGLTLDAGLRPVSMASSASARLSLMFVHGSIILGKGQGIESSDLRSILDLSFSLSQEGTCPNVLYRSYCRKTSRSILERRKEKMHERCGRQP